MKIKSIHFQRNGVNGNPFFTVYFTDDSHDDFKGNLVATFETAQNDDEHIDRRTCRLINTDKPELAYRGDECADDLQKEFNKLMKNAKTSYGIYEFTENNKRITEQERIANNFTPEQI